MAVLPLTLAPTSWSDIIESLVAPYRQATIEVFDPKVYTEDAPYNVLTDTGGNRTYTTLWTGLARIIELSIQQDKTSGDEWGTRRMFHMDVALTDDLPFFYKGLAIKVLDGHRDHSLEQVAFTIESALNSSEANQRDILAITEGAAVPSG